jgi:hypothetical protein
VLRGTASVKSGDCGGSDEVADREEGQEMRSASKCEPSSEVAICIEGKSDVVPSKRPEPSCVGRLEKRRFDDTCDQLVLAADSEATSERSSSLRGSR